MNKMLKKVSSMKVEKAKKERKQNLWLPDLRMQLLLP
tara:strand:+ start:526 stop:636 length:111 start_codon:yes stop_codon:yes gene_type:complete